jgi:hypothetical protein
MLPAMIRVAPAYLDSQFDAAEYDGLAWLSSMICASDAFRPEHPTYGLSQSLFLLVEGLSWFAQAARSGVRTYFEATPVERQQAMLRALEHEAAPDDLLDNYRSGISAWRDPVLTADLDRWIDRSDEANTRYLWSLARAHRPEIEALIA